MFEKLRQELENQNAFNTPIPKTIYDLANVITDPRINDKMKLMIAVNEAILFASQFHRSIVHYNGSLIPINAISFILSPSGLGKDSSVNLIHRCFKEGYDEINKIRTDKAIDRAKELAKQAKKVRFDDASEYMKYYDAPNPLFASLSTNEGLIAHLNTLDDDGIGAGFIYTGEFTSELQNSSSLLSNLTLLSEMYDEGKKEVKIIKSKQSQSKEIKNLPFSGLFMSSPDILFYDEKAKREFSKKFNSKLSRRSFFCFIPVANDEVEYASVRDMINAAVARENLAYQKVRDLQEMFKAISLREIGKLGQNITMTTECSQLMLVYKTYCSESAEKLDKTLNISRLNRTHAYWRAFKLAGALALLKGLDSITELEYKEAISFTESILDDIVQFEKELAKEPYQMLVTLAEQSTTLDSIFSLNLHQLKKLGFIPSIRNVDNTIKDLVKFANSVDDKGYFEVTTDGIEYKKIIKTDLVNVSFVSVNGDKEQRKAMCASGYQSAELPFSRLADMLQKDFAYTPFKFKNGIRSNANVYGKIKWIALDIDNSNFDDEMVHEFLKEFNHHIVRTSDTNNAYKYRVLLELDSLVELSDIEYKGFIKAISDFLGLNADILPRSQIYYSYSDRNVLSVTNANPLEAREFLLIAKGLEDSNVYISPSDLTAEQKATQLENPQATFDFAFNAPQGKGSVALWRAARMAKELGMSNEDIINLVYEINSYWTYPMPKARLRSTIISQVLKWN